MYIYILNIANHITRHVFVSHQIHLFIQWSKVHKVAPTLPVRPSVVASPPWKSTDLERASHGWWIKNDQEWWKCLESQVGTCMKKNILRPWMRCFYFLICSCTEVLCILWMMQLTISPSAIPRRFFLRSRNKPHPESKSLAFAIAPVTFPKTDKTINDIAASGWKWDASPWVKCTMKQTSPINSR